MHHTDGYLESAEFYDHVVPYRNRDDVRFFVDEAVRSKGPVLEIGCGTGRVLIPTARAGIGIDGLDLSPRMLGVCRENLSRESAEVRSRVHLHQADMTTFELPGKFALVTMPFRSFQHLLTVEEQVRCLQRVHRHLEPGGTFILDVFNPILERLVMDDLGKEVDEEPEFTMPDGRRVVRRARTLAKDILQQVLHIELIYDVTHPDGRTERQVHSIRLRYFFRFEVEHLLARCGFELETVYADYERHEYGSTYPGELICVGRKSPR
jgi:SAM-dependent methyltransferase